MIMLHPRPGQAESKVMDVWAFSISLVLVLSVKVLNG